MTAPAAGRRQGTRMFFPLESVPYTKRDQILVVIAANTCERAIGRVINQLGPAPSQLFVEGDLGPKSRSTNNCESSNAPWNILQRLVGDLASFRACQGTAEADQKAGQPADPLKPYPLNGQEDICKRPAGLV